MTTHPWLEKYPINVNSKYLIIGTHPPMPYCGRLEFYYGNMSEFWRFLDKVYPDNKLYYNGCPQLNDIINFLHKNKMSVTDMVYNTVVEKFSTDVEMGKINSIDLNPYLFDWLNSSEIETIYFTSFSGTNSAKNLFKKWYHSMYKIESKKHKIKKDHFNNIELSGRTIKLFDLFSPSPTARKSAHHIKEYQEWKINNDSSDFDSFRIHWYKTYLPKILK